MWFFYPYWLFLFFELGDVCIVHFVHRKKTCLEYTIVGFGECTLVPPTRLSSRLIGWGIDGWIGASALWCCVCRQFMHTQSVVTGDVVDVMSKTCWMNWMNCLFTFFYDYESDWFCQRYKDLWCRIKNIQHWTTWTQIRIISSNWMNHLRMWSWTTESSLCHCFFCNIIKKHNNVLLNNQCLVI